MILDICENPTVLEIMRIVKIAVTIIRIVVPIILILSLMIGYTRAISSKDTDLLAKANKAAVAKAIAAILVFFIPTFVNIVVNIASGDNESYVSCINLATSENISAAYSNMAQKYLDQTKSSLSESDYNMALSYINKIDNESTKNKMLSELNDIKKYIDIAKEIDELKQSYSASKYNELLNKINNISDNTYKQKLLKMLKEVPTETSTGGSSGGSSGGSAATTGGSSGGSGATTGGSLNIDSAFKEFKDTKYSLFKGYYLYIPKNATENMPLVVMFPPNSLSGANMANIAQTKSLDNFRGFIYIPLLASSTRQDWTTSASTQAVKKIQDLITEYHLNQNKISLTAFSSSGWYIYWTANTYRIFSAIAPISSGMGIDTIKKYYNDWEYLKTLPMKGYGEKGGATTASGRSCAGKTVNWSAKTAMCSTFEGLGKCSDCLNCANFTYMSESCHGEMGNHVFSIDENNNNISDILEWMIAQ